MLALWVSKRKCIYIYIWQLHGPGGFVLDVVGVRLMLALTQGTDVAARPRDGIVHALAVCPLEQLHIREVRGLAECSRRSRLFCAGRERRRGLMMPCQVPLQNKTDLCPHPDCAAAPRHRPPAGEFTFLDDGIASRRYCGGGGNM